MDRYTKALLTLITICLLWISLKDIAFISEAMASSGVIDIRIVDISSYHSLPVKAEGELTCKVR